MWNMRNQKVDPQETTTFPDEEETETERSYIFVYKTPDGRTCQTQTQHETDTRSVTDLERIGHVVVSVVVFVRIIARGIRNQW